jgi:hypothetical protein
MGEFPQLRFQARGAFSEEQVTGESRLSAVPGARRLLEEKHEIEAYQDHMFLLPFLRGHHVFGH